MILDLFDRKIPQSIKVKVTPKSKLNRLKKEYLSNGEVLYRVYVTQAPENGKANKAIIELIAKDLKIAKTRISIVKGEFAKEKIIKIS